MSHNLRRLRHVKQPSLERVTFRRFLADSSGDGVDGPGPAGASCPCSCSCSRSAGVVTEGEGDMARDAGGKGEGESRRVGSQDAA
jgi:hypothetical protein